eukprot:scaffold4084_cov290-Prasinococcus_capsulatus_cf.AAC.3
MIRIAVSCVRGARLVRCRAHAVRTSGQQQRRVWTRARRPGRPQQHSVRWRTGACRADGEVAGGDRNCSGGGRSRESRKRGEARLLAACGDLFEHCMRSRRRAQAGLVLAEARAGGQDATCLANCVAASARSSSSPTLLGQLACGREHT